jgi:hypothetical protein
MNIKVGDVVVFKGDGFLYQILSRILKLFEPEYDRFGWHMGFVCGNGCIAEALAKGVCVNPLSDYEKREYRVYRWLDTEPDVNKVMEFVAHHKGDRYDSLCYVLTFIQRAVYKLTKKQLPRLSDDSYTCWEWCEFFCTVFGKPWTMTAPLMFPLLTDFINQRPTMVVNHSGYLLMA